MKGLVSRILRPTEDQSQRVTETPQPTLWEFVRQAWHVLEPAHPFVDNWHVGAICELLTAVTLGQIQNLLINIPPRHMKSLLVSVFWPCWEWGPRLRPDLRYINSSYASHLSIRDNVKSRTLIQSGWYQSQWGSVFRLRDDQNVKVKFENYQGGFRLASYVKGGTGEGGDRLICDDPNNVTDVESDVIRATTNDWWDLQMYNRITNPSTSARVMIMQRTHQGDLSGHVIETGGWTICKLPTKFVASNRCTIVYADGTKTWTDPRKKDGELLNPGLWDETAIELEERRLRTFGFSGQHQQEPVPKGGGQFQRRWFKVTEEVPKDFVELTRFWDTAATEGGGDWTAGVLMGRRSTGDVWILDVKHKQFSSGKVDELIGQTAKGDGVITVVREEEEPGASGKTVTMARARKLFGYNYKGIRATGSPDVRCEPFSAACVNAIFELGDRQREASELINTRSSSSATGRALARPCGSAGSSRRIPSVEVASSGVHPPSGVPG